jgi:hypothetical protein
MRIYSIEEVVKSAPPVDNAIDKLITQIDAWQSHYEGVIVSMKKAIETLAAASGMFPCEYCGALTDEVIPVAGHSDEMGYESTNHCRSCLP